MQFRPTEHKYKILRGGLKDGEVLRWSVISDPYHFPFLTGTQEHCPVVLELTYKQGDQKDTSKMAEKEAFK
jgi:hypothetical protein